MEVGIDHHMSLKRENFAGQRIQSSKTLYNLEKEDNIRRKIYPAKGHNIS